MILPRFCPTRREVRLRVFLKAQRGDTVDTKNLHDLNILQSYNSQGIRYLGSCRIFSIHRSSVWSTEAETYEEQEALDKAGKSSTLNPKP